MDYVVHVQPPVDLTDHQSKNKSRTPYNKTQANKILLTYVTVTTMLYSSAQVSSKQ